jgi:hypothetical protein
VRGWLILVATLLTGIILGIGAATMGPVVVAPYLPKSMSGQGERMQAEPGDTLTLITSGYATFVEDPVLDRVQRPSGPGLAPSQPPASPSTPQSPKDKTGR